MKDEARLDGNEAERRGPSLRSVPHHSAPIQKEISENVREGLDNVKVFIEVARGGRRTREP